MHHFGPDEPRNPDPRQQHEAPHGQERGQERFRREGPEPAKGDTGRTVDEMNEAAEASVVNNVTPDEAVD